MKSKVIVCLSLLLILGGVWYGFSKQKLGFNINSYKDDKIVDVTENKTSDADIRTITLNMRNKEKKIDDYNELLSLLDNMEYKNGTCDCDGADILSINNQIYYIYKDINLIEWNDKHSRVEENLLDDIYTLIDN